MIRKFNSLKLIESLKSKCVKMETVINAPKNSANYLFLKKLMCLLKKKKPIYYVL